MAFLCQFLPGGGCKKEKISESVSPTCAVDKEFSQGPLQVHIKLDRDRIDIAQTLTLRFEAAVESGYELTLPNLPEFLLKKELAILDTKIENDRLFADNRVLKQRQYRLEPIVSGELSLPALKFVFYKMDVPSSPDSPEPQQELTTEPIPITVTSSVEQNRSDLALRDIRGLAAWKTALSKSWYLAAAALILLTAVILLLFWRRQRRQQLSVRIFKTAHEIAFGKLAQLEQENLLDVGRVKEFYERLNLIVRHYIEDRFDLNAPEQTTEEFLRDQRLYACLDQDQQDHLQHFLQHCDMVKFACYLPRGDEICTTVTLTRDFIEFTRSLEKQVEITPKSSDARPQRRTA